MDSGPEIAALGRRRPKQERAKAKYDAILSAGLEVLRREGYSGATTAKIAKEAGVSIGTVYAYFADKDEIFAAFVDTRFVGIMDGIAANVSTARYETVETGIRDIMTLGVRFTLMAKPTLSAMVGHVPGVYDGMMLQPIIEQVYEVAEEFFRAHDLVSTTEQARRVTYTLTGAVSGYFIRLVSEPELAYPEEEIVDELVALIMGYIGRYGRT